ncbi:hypothetical protein EV401DRAFT_1883756 [Pisolithus croceorrhizus]|nr:hypothetical protein EV401DRAFT_1883756 [Pisolithus croceorrhizus]
MARKDQDKVLLGNILMLSHSGAQNRVRKYIYSSDESLCADYELYPPSTAKTKEECITAVKKKANDLLSTGKYLCGEPDGQGRASNFAHHALKNTILAFCYANTSKCPHQFLEFQEYIPYKALVLITAMIHVLLSLFRKYGIDKSAHLNLQGVEEGYVPLNEAISTVLDHPHHGLKLNMMHVDWAQVGIFYNNGYYQSCGLYGVGEDFTLSMGLWQPQSLYGVVKAH